MKLKILKQVDELGCGIACIAMIRSDEKTHPRSAYEKCLKALFPDYPEVRKYEGYLDVRTKIGQLQSYLNNADRMACRKKYTNVELGNLANGLAIALIEVDSWLHWIIVCRVSDRVYVVDPEIGKHCEYKEYFADKSRRLIEDKMHLCLADLHVDSICS